MLPLIVSFALLQNPDQPPRLKTVLENEAVVLVEPMPGEKVVSIQLFASSKYVPETEATHGFRHLLEHLISRGEDGLVDRRLETQACFLTARTLRDAMQIELTVGPTQVKVGLDTLASILHRPAFKQEDIDKELRVMRDELAMEDEPFLLSSASWKTAFGEAGLDPEGTFDSMYRATPEKLADVYEKQFAADGLALVIAGPVDLDSATSLARSVLAPLLKHRGKPAHLARPGKPGRGTSEGFGESRAALVPEFNTPQTAAALAAGLAIASEQPSAFVTFTPSARAGLVVVGHTDSNSGLGLYIDGLESGAELYERGRALAREWVLRQLKSASGTAYLRGLLLSQGPAYRPEMLLEQINSLKPETFEKAIKAFKSDQAVVAVGSR